MKISAKTEYACQALLELGLHWPKEDPLSIQTIARKRRIPLKFLTHILLQLKQSGYVRSLLGQRGGYLLARQPKDITLHNLIRQFETSGRSGTSGRAKNDVWRNIFQEADKVLENYLSSLTLEDIIRLERTAQKIPMYTI